LVNYITSLCKQECSIIKHVRYAKRALTVLTALNNVKKALMRASACQCGLDSSYCHADTAAFVAKMDRPGLGNHGDSSEPTLVCVATLHRFGLPFDYAKQDPKTFPETCACSKAPMWDPASEGTTRDTIFAWQCHLGRCAGGYMRMK
jgi:hypothetical protein